MTTDYIEKFATLIEALKQNSAIEILKVTGKIDVNLKRSEYAYRDLRETYGYELPQYFKTCFDISVGTQLRFVYYIGKKVAGGGEFHLYPLYDSLISERDPELWYDGMSKDQISILKTFRVIDDHPESGDSKLAAFSKQEGVSPPRVPDIYFYDRGDYFKMNIDYGGYLDALLDLIGVSNWQYLFCDVELKAPPMFHVYNALKKTLDDFRKIFPDHDFSKYDAMLERRRG